jgi:DNA-binding LacI/PurR family transcriptional regulator
MNKAFCEHSGGNEVYPLPRRTLLGEEVAQIIKKCIENGRWQNCLPGERKLSAELRVSRPTVRNAIELLVNEGILGSKARCNRLILKNTRPSAGSSSLIGVLIPQQLEKMESNFLLKLLYLQKCLTREGLDTRILSATGCYSQNPRKALQWLINNHKYAAWVLVQSTPLLQNFFQKNDLPCVVMGTTDGEINLPSIDYDQSALARHAVGLMSSRGHDSIEYITKVPLSSEQIACKRAFLEAAGKSGGKGKKALVVEYDGLKDSLCLILDRKTADGSLPKGFLVSHAHAVLTIVTHLARVGLRPGNDYSILCQEDDPILKDFSPEIARYSFNYIKYATKLLAFVKKLASRAKITKRCVRIIPDFQEGGSIVKASSR